MFQPHTWPLISEPRREGRTGEGVEVAGGRGDQPCTCPQGPRSKVCTVLPVRDPTPQLTALLDHMLCTKDAQRDPRPSPAPTPQPPATGSSAKLGLHKQPHTQPASVTLTDDLGAGEGHIKSHNPVPWTQYKPPKHEEPASVHSHHLRFAVTQSHPHTVNPRPPKHIPTAGFQAHKCSVT